MNPTNDRQDIIIDRIDRLIDQLDKREISIDPMLNTDYDDNDNDKKRAGKLLNNCDKNSNVECSYMEVMQAFRKIDTFVQQNSSDSNESDLDLMSSMKLRLAEIECNKLKRKIDSYISDSHH